MNIINSKPLVSAEEAVKISYKNGTIDTVQIAKEVADQWGGVRYADRSFNYYCMLAAVYTAGYIHGKREERQRKKRREATRQ